MQVNSGMFHDQNFFSVISFGIDGSHLLTASVMSAPAALAFAKLFYPETKKSKTTADNLIFPASKIIIF
jgi:pyrimidine nucleoside transport protein